MLPFVGYCTLWCPLKMSLFILFSVCSVRQLICFSAVITTSLFSVLSPSIFTTFRASPLRFCFFSLSLSFSRLSSLSALSSPYQSLLLLHAIFCVCSVFLWLGESLQAWWFPLRLLSPADELLNRRTDLWLYICSWVCLFSDSCFWSCVFLAVSVPVPTSWVSLFFSLKWQTSRSILCLFVSLWR